MLFLNKPYVPERMKYAIFLVVYKLEENHVGNNTIKTTTYDMNRSKMFHQLVVIVFIHIVQLFAYWYSGP